MRSPTDPQRIPLPLSPSLPASARAALPREGAAWAAWAALVFAAGAWWGVPQDAPALALGLAVGVGLWAAHPRSPLGLLAATFVVAATAGLTAPLDLHPVWIAGGLAGGLAGQLRRAPLHERLQAMLAGLAGAGLAAVAADTLGLRPDHVATAALVGAGAACALVPLHLAWTPVPPGARQLRRTLNPVWREPAQRAARLHAQLLEQRPDPETREGLSEVACWVYRLALSLQRLDAELTTLPERQIQQRLGTLLDQVDGSDDLFLRDRRLATVAHYQQVLAQVDELRLERERLRSLQEYALAYLEEARLGLVLARTLPGQGVPDRLDEVLGRLRTDASEATTLRRTAQELAVYG